jgi:hypothetical protein
VKPIAAPSGMPKVFAGARVNIGFCPRAKAIFGGGFGYDTIPDQSIF